MEFQSSFVVSVNFLRNIWGVLLGGHIVAVLVDFTAAAHPAHSIRRFRFVFSSRSSLSSQRLLLHCYTVPKDRTAADAQLREELLRDLRMAITFSQRLFCSILLSATFFI